AADKEFEVAAKEGSANDDRWMMRKGGERFWASGVTMAARDDEGKLIGFTKVLRDLTERKRIEEELRREPLDMRTPISKLPQQVRSCRTDGECDYLSPPWVRYTGIPEQESLGSRWLDQVHPDDREPALEAWKRAMEEKSAFDVEYRLRGADGNYRWFKARARP